MPPRPAPAAAPAQRREFVHPQASHAKKKGQPSPYGIEPITVFYIFLFVNIVAAAYAPIQDCDETFNYWEPTHYLSHGYGLQTWEYSPDYAIRSWLYTGLHAIIANIRRILPRSSKTAEFYFVRYALGFACALCQTLMWRAICMVLTPRVGMFFIMALATSPGNFHSAAAYLPSSFAMYMAMVGAAAFMNWRGGLKTSQGIFWFAVGGVIGWPFAAALCAPFLLEEALFAFMSDKDAFLEAIVRFFRGVIAALIVVFFDFCLNTFFYKKPEVVSWNIVKYNLFSETGGPNLYGTEPWTYYFRNLTLNFHIWFALALISLPLFFLQKIISPSTQGFSSGLRSIVFLAPFYMWLGIFTLQPHKEERFMYPAYPFLALNGAMSLHILLTAFGRTIGLVGMIPARVKLYFVTLIAFLSLDLSVLRIYGLYSAYSAPLTIYQPLQEIGRRGESVCFGKDWYRFPTSYFLPNDMRPKFIRSEFRGLLPGEFSEARTGFGFWSGTWLPTAGFNDHNEEDLGKYVDIRTCAYLVDTQFPEQQEAVANWTAPPDEPDYVADTENWEEVKCVPFLDAASTSFLARAWYVPGWLPVGDKYKRKWGRHCLLKNRKKSSRSDTKV